jgi:hypothetical protein
MISTRGSASALDQLHLPDLGRRGEGCVAAQSILFGAIIGSGLLGRAWAALPGHWGDRRIRAADRAGRRRRHGKGGRTDLRRQVGRRLSAMGSRLGTTSQPSARQSRH